MTDKQLAALLRAYVDDLENIRQDLLNDSEEIRKRALADFTDMLEHSAIELE